MHKKKSNLTQPYQRPTKPHFWMRHVISASSRLWPKQVQFTLFKLPWPAALIESLRSDSCPSRQLKASPRQRMHAGGGGKCTSLWHLKYECSIYTRTACSTLKFDSLNIKSTSWARGELCTRWRLYPSQYGGWDCMDDDGIAVEMRAKDQQTNSWRGENATNEICFVAWLVNGGLNRKQAQRKSYRDSHVLLNIVRLTVQSLKSIMISELWHQFLSTFFFNTSLWDRKSVV